MKPVFRISFSFWVILLCLSFSQCSIFEPPFDLVIKNGHILDGSGNPWFKSDIGIKGSKIQKVGKIDDKKAKKIIDASELFVTPGFIDVHTHCDRGIVRIPTVDNYILQGVTTVIGGNCGGHSYPLSEL